MSASAAAAAGAAAGERTREPAVDGAGERSRMPAANSAVPGAGGCDSPSGSGDRILGGLREGSLEGSLGEAGRGGAGSEGGSQEGSQEGSEMGPLEGSREGSREGSCEGSRRGLGGREAPERLGRVEAAARGGDGYSRVDRLLAADVLNTATPVRAFLVADPAAEGRPAEMSQFQILREGGGNPGSEAVISAESRCGLGFRICLFEHEHEKWNTLVCYCREYLIVHSWEKKQQFGFMSHREKTLVSTP